MLLLQRIRHSDPDGAGPAARTAVPPVARAARPSASKTATRTVAGTTAPAPSCAAAAVRRPALPPSVARVAARTRLSAELLAAMLEVDRRTRATLDDMERADALAERLLARRRQRLAAAAGAPHPAC